MTTLLLTLAGLGAALIVGVWTTERMLRDSVFTAALIVGLRLTGTFLGSWSPEPVIADLTVVPQDVVFLMAAGTGFLRLFRLRELDRMQRLIVVLLVLVAVAALRGLGPNGLQDTARESRNFLYFFGGVLYFSTVDPTDEVIRRIGRIWIIAAAAFGAIVLFRWAALVVGAPPVGIFTRSREAGGIRVIDAQNTLVVLEGMFLMGILWLRRLAKPTVRYLLVALIPIVVFLQHRTIWIVAIVATITVAVRNPRFGRVALATIVAGAAALGVVTAALSTDTEVVPRDPTDTGTIVWRFEGWKGLVTQRDAPPLELAIGTPLGSGYERQLASSGNVVDTSPHNFYVQMYLRIGVIGLILFLLLWVPPMVWLARRTMATRDLVSEVCLTLLIMQATFMLAWTLDFDQGIVTGLAGAIVHQRRGRDRSADAVTRQATLVPA